MVAGPDFTLKLTAKPLLASGAVTAKGKSPKALFSMFTKAAIVWLALETVKLVVTSGAGL